ncbi:NAD(P)-binding domain-containing protein [Niallia oryzisoli]|uniref:NAD(P)-binding domain-containing protein n=1 Tax=Niallia oryzisoli TaxID=1737571 RepID=A0ABZ2CFZ9_9BACI
MQQIRVGLVGIGRLGTSLVKQWDQMKKAIGVYHPDTLKLDQFCQSYENSYPINKRELENLDVIILALSAAGIIPFISSLLAEDISLGNTKIVNMATALSTIEICKKFPLLNVYGVKYMGHSRDLLENGDGLFISETSLPTQIEEYFSSIGRIKLDTEERLIEVNTLATYYAAKAAIELESIFAKKALDPEYAARALTSIAPEVIRSYSNGTLGHFAKEIVKELQGTKAE